MSLNLWKTSLLAARNGPLLHSHFYEVKCLRKGIWRRETFIPFTGATRRAVQLTTQARSSLKYLQHQEGHKSYRSRPICSAATQNAPIAFADAQEQEGNLHLLSSCVSDISTRCSGNPLPVHLFLSSRKAAIGILQLHDMIAYSSLWACRRQ